MIAFTEENRVIGFHVKQSCRVVIEDQGFQLGGAIY